MSKPKHTKPQTQNNKTCLLRLPPRLGREEVVDAQHRDLVNALALELRERSQVTRQVLVLFVCLFVGMGMGMGASASDSVESSVDTCMYIAEKETH